MGSDQSRVMMGLRWVAIAPIASIALILTALLMEAAKWLMGSVGEAPLAVFVQNAAMGWAFVSAGVLMAPAHKKGVAITLCVTFAILLGMSITMAILKDRPMHVVYCMLGVAGSCWAMYEVVFEKNIHAPKDA